MRQGITDEQNRLLTSWLGSYTVVRDYSWPLQDTNVLHVVTPSGADFIIKASTTSHHIHREIAAHAAGFEGLDGRVPALRHASVRAGILVTEFLPGTLVEGTPAEDDPETGRSRSSTSAGRNGVHGCTTSCGSATSNSFRGQNLPRLSQACLGRTLGPAEADLWRLENLNQAIGTVVWAHQMGDTAFEQAGRDMVERVLAAR